MKRLTTKEFIEKAQAVHGNRYDYSRVEYVNVDTGVTIICPDHGPFSQTPYKHVNGRGCPDCGGSKPLTTETFVENARSIHGDRYDYSQVEYVNNKTAVTIVCPDHGTFSQSPSNHINHKAGCPDCGGSKPLTTETFVENARSIHGDRYDYSQVEYVNNKTVVTIVCPDHGPFSQSPSKHINRKAGCPDCAGNKPLTAGTFAEKAKEIHGDRYDYSSVNYVNNNTDVTIICPDHGPFPQAPDNHLLGKGCRECGGTKPLTTETFVENAKEIHGDRYDYSQVEYVNAATHVTIICPDHGPFPQTPNNHLRRRSCPDCAEGGFNPSEPGTLYYIAVTTDDGDTRYKIGITNYTVEERFPAPDLARIRIVKTWGYALGRAAAEREAEILKQYAGDRYYGPDILVGAGNTELFTHDIFGLDACDESND